MSVTKIEQKREKKTVDGNHTYKIEKNVDATTVIATAAAVAAAIVDERRDKHERTHKQIYSGKINRNKMEWK